MRPLLAQPKIYTRLDRAIAKKAARLEDAVKLLAWAKAVKERDQWKDRRTGVRVRSTRELDPLRAEAHHLVSKDDRAVRYDVRNGICLSFETHDLVERYVLRIRGDRVLLEGRGALHRCAVSGPVRPDVIAGHSVGNFGPTDCTVRHRTALSAALDT